MLEKIRLDRVDLPAASVRPDAILPLFAAAERGDPLEPAVSAIVSALGFETFVYAMQTGPSFHRESLGYYYTTAPQEWAAIYDQQAYLEVDPRVLNCWSSAIPFVWDQVSERGKGPRSDAFLRDAAKHGIASGVAFALHDARQAHAIIGLSSATEVIDSIARDQIAKNIGEILLLGHYFHELFARAVIEKGIAPLSRGAPLSARQRECLTLAAHGQTTEDIAAKLQISERTVLFHFSDIRSKLAANNRQEAIAKAVAAGLIKV